MPDKDSKMGSVTSEPFCCSKIITKTQKKIQLIGVAKYEAIVMSQSSWRASTSLTITGNTKGGRITVPLTSCLTGLVSSGPNIIKLFKSVIYECS